MAKIDRIPNIWPALMSDVMAAAYLDMSASQFRTLVNNRRLPKGRAAFDTGMIRWRKAELDAAINTDFGLPAKVVSAQAEASSNEWMDAINAS